MGSEDGVKSFGGVAFDRGDGAEIPGIGKKDVKAMEAGQSLGDVAPGIGLVSDVGGDGKAIGAKGLGGCGKGLRVMVDQGDVAAMVAQQAGRGKADGACAAGGEGGLAGKAKGVRHRNTRCAARSYP